MVLQVVTVIMAAASFTPVTYSQGSAKTYVDSRGNKVTFPLGDSSFADEVVEFKKGTPSSVDARFSNPKLALGSPDYRDEPSDSGTPADLTLGCGGTLTVRFADNVLVDVSGPDLYVFEVGPAVEATNLEISVDRRRWIDVGRISGGVAAVDIAKAGQFGDRYRFVRLTDLRTHCDGDFPGADIDAVGAIGSILDIVLDASVLFDFNKSTLRPEARIALGKVAGKIAAVASARIAIEGHSDNVGGVDYNARLSQARAEQVRAFLITRPELKGRTIIATGFGATRPIASNDTEQGRQQNRRVEIVVNPVR